MHFSEETASVIEKDKRMSQMHSHLKIHKNYQKPYNSTVTKILKKIPQKPYSVVKNLLKIISISSKLGLLYQIQTKIQ